MKQQNSATPSGLEHHTGRIAIIDEHFERHLEGVRRARESLGPTIAAGAQELIRALKAGNKILLCGNGGSAADAQHIAAELTGRYQTHRKALPAMALSTDSSAVTSISNDFGFDAVFARQVEAHGNPGDVLVAISTSGHSGNVVQAVRQAKGQGLFTLGLLGCQGGVIARLVDRAIVVPADETPHIQEIHITIGHILCALVDWAFRAEISGI